MPRASSGWEKSFLSKEVKAKQAKGAVVVYGHSRDGCEVASHIANLFQKARGKDSGNETNVYCLEGGFDKFVRDLGAHGTNGVFAGKNLSQAVLSRTSKELTKQQQHRPGFDQRQNMDHDPEQQAGRPRRAAPNKTTKMIVETMSTPIAERSCLFEMIQEQVSDAFNCYVKDVKDELLYNPWTAAPVPTKHSRRGGGASGSGTTG
eukprot:GSA120T00001763001.1